MGEDSLKPVTPTAHMSKLALELNRALEHGNTQKAKDLASKLKDLIVPLDEYLAEISTTPSDDLKALERASYSKDWEKAYNEGETDLLLEREMVSGGLEGQFLKMLVQITHAKKIIEIGSFTGYASLAMAEGLPAEGKLIACEFDSFAADFSEKLLAKSKHGNKVEVVKGDAMSTLKALKKKGEVFDFAFIDADKTGYLRYYKFLVDNQLIRTGGMIAVDNTLYQGEAYGVRDVSVNGKSIADFNDFVANDERVDQVVVPLRDGVSLIRMR